MFNGSNICLFGILCILFSAVPSFAGSILSVSPSGLGVFILQGSGLVDTAVIDVEISYDSSSLVNPRVMQGSLISGGMTAANVDVPGIMRFTVIPNRAVKGNGTIATISFTRTGDAPGRISSLSGRIADSAGKAIPVSYNVQNPQDTPVGNLNQGQGQTTPVPGRLSSTQSQQQPAGDGGTQYPFVVGGNLTLPSDDVAGKDQKPAILSEARETTKEETDVALLPADSLKTASPKADPPKAAETAAEVMQSVLERFRLFQGKPTMAAWMELFNQSDVSRFRQDPPIVIANGKNSLKVSISNIAGTHVPNFALTAARVVSLKMSGNGWVVEVKPNAGVIRASVTVLTDSGVYEFPLIVSPAADIDFNRSGDVTEEDFVLYLKERSAAKVPKYDLSGDGKRDYMDDYILTANYLVLRAQPIRKPVVAGNATKELK